MPATTDDLLKTIARYRSSYNLSGQLKNLAGTDEALATLLWEARKAGLTTMESSNYLLLNYPGAPHLWNADDFCELVIELQKYHPDGAFTSSASGWTDTLPGSAWGIWKMIKEKRGDAEFARVMRERWASLPTYWGTAVGVFLVGFGHMPYSELSKDLQQLVARLHLQKGAAHSSIEAPYNFPPDVWGRLLVEVASDPHETFRVEGLLVLPPLKALLSLDELLMVMRRCSTHYELLPAINKLGDLGPEAIPKLQDALLKLQITPRDSNNWDAPRPQLVYGLIYLRHCQAAGQTPPAFMDRVFAESLEHMALGWSGGHIQETMAAISDALTVIPQPRLEKVLLYGKRLPWEVIGCCLTPTVLQGLTDWIATLPGKGNYDNDQLVNNLIGENYNDYGREGALHSLREALVPYCVAALKAKKPAPQRRIYVVMLRKSGLPEAAEGLTRALNDTSKAVRTEAISGLTALGPDACAPHLQAALTSKRKDGRLAAAQVMAALPADARVYALAQAQLAKEKVAAVKTALEAVSPAAEGAEVGSSRIEALLEAEGASWKEHDGPELLGAYFQAMARYWHESIATTYQPICQNWLAVLQAHSASPEALTMALRMLGGFSTSYGGDYLSALDERFSNQLPVALAVKVGAGISRPPAMGKSRYTAWGLKETITWAADSERVARYAGVLVAALSDKRVGPRKASLKGLIAAGVEAADALEQGITSTNARVRAGCAEALDALALPRSLRPATDALAGESDKTAKAALMLAVAAISAASVDISAFPEGPAGTRALGGALAALPLPVPTQKAPALTWRGGDNVRSAVSDWFFATLSRESLTRHTPLLLAVRERLDDDACALALPALGHGAATRGAGLFARAILGGDDEVRAIAAALPDLAESVTTHWGGEGVEALARNGSPLAIRSLDRANKKARRDALKHRAGSALSRLADRRDVTVADLLDSAISDYGFDLRGQRAVDYGGRPLTLRLSNENALRILDENGKVFKNLPKPRKGDDVTAAAVVKKEVSAIRKEIRQVQAHQKTNLDAALTDQRTWTPARWRERFLDHALMRAFSRGIVWETVDAEGAAVSGFIVTDDGELVDAELEPVPIPADGAVRLLHPLGRSPEALAGWKSALDDFEVITVIDQLERDVYAVADVPDDRALFSGWPMSNAGRFMGRLSRLGFERGPREGAGLINYSWLSIGTVSFTVNHTWYSPETPEEENMEIESINAHVGGDSVPWREAPAIAVSELIRRLHQLMGA